MVKRLIVYVSRIIEHNPLVANEHFAMINQIFGIICGDPIFRISIRFTQQRFYLSVKSLSVQLNCLFALTVKMKVWSNI